MGWFSDAFNIGKGDGITGQLSRIDKGVEGSEKAIRDAIASALNLGNTGSSQQDFQNTLAPLQDQIGRLDSAYGALNGLTGELKTSALASTSGAGIAAANAARLSGSGRFGSGGNAALLAARGATDAAVGQSAALTNAMVQGRLATSNYQSNILQQRGGISAALSQLFQGQAGLKEERARLPIQLQTELANVLLGGAGVHQGIATQKLAGNAQLGSSVMNLAGQLL